METIHRIHKVEVEILDEIVRICNKHNLTYFLVGGTLLGAVRHKGFIPWDDDLDIGMLREDYNRFLEIAEKELSEKYVLQYQKSEENYWLVFAKVRRKNTIYDEVIADHNIKEKGFWVDIFPLERSEGLDMPKEKRRMKKLLFLKKVTHLRRIWNNSNEKKKIPLKTQIFIKFTELLGIDNVKLLNVYSKVASSMQNGNCIINYGSRYGVTRQTMPLDYYFPISQVEFEGKLYSAPHKPKEVLEKIYGKDYMQLPPLEQRVVHVASQIDFGERTEEK